MSWQGLGALGVASRTAERHARAEPRHGSDDLLVSSARSARAHASGRAFRSPPRRGRTGDRAIFFPALMTSSENPHPHSERPELALRLARTPEASRKGLLLEWLRRTIAELSGRDDPRELRPEQKLFEVGLKSLHLNELRSRLERECGVEFPVALCFTHTTLHAVAEHVG